jgi:hypothetical protein
MWRPFERLQEKRIGARSPEAHAPIVSLCRAQDKTKKGQPKEKTNAGDRAFSPSPQLSAPLTAVALRPYFSNQEAKAGAAGRLLLK